MGISALLAAQILDASATGRSVLTGADASAIRTTLGLGTLATQSPTGTPSASTFLRGDFSWQTIDLSGYVPYTGATGAVNLGANAFTASRATLSTGTITASTPALNVTQTWNNAATTFTGILANVTDTASNANSLLLDLQVGGTSRLLLAKNGTLQGVVGRFTNAHFAPSFFANSIYLLGSGGSVAWRDNAIAEIGTTDLFLFRDAANTLAQRNSTNAQRLNLYGTYTDASNYERAKLAWESNVLRIGTEKAGTGSARALELQTDGTTRLTIGNTGLFAIADALNIAVGTTTGTKIGTATTQKIGFYDKTPVVQPTAVADATDAASVITQLNALLSRMRDLGLIAT